MPKIRMPDGQIVAFPDDMPREQIKSLIAQKYPELQQQTQTDTFNVYTTNITQFRKQYPQYNDLSDDVLVQKLHDKFYPDMEMSEFSQHFGYKKTDLSKYSDEELMQIAGIQRQSQPTYNYVNIGLGIFSIIIICIFLKYAAKNKKLSTLLKSFKNILFISYLKNKGYRRICTIIGVFLGLFPLLLGNTMHARIQGFLIAFYLPFLIACLIKWVIQGFKENKPQKKIKRK